MQGSGRAGRLADKVGVVTGGAAGIGRGIATVMAAEGARVLIADKNEAGEEVAASIRDGGGQAVFTRADVTLEADCDRLVATAVREFGRLDALVNNVGWFPRATLEETTAELWDEVLAVNLRSAFFCCRAAVGPLRAAGGGSIVNIGSINGIQGLPALVAYASAKGGLLALTRTLAGALAADRIRVNYVIPGWVLTETERNLHTSRGVSEEDLVAAGRTLPLGRHQTPEDTAWAVVYLVSDESSQVTGTVLHIDAGASELPIQPGGPYVG